MQIIPLRKLYLFFFLLLAASSCIEPVNKFEKLPPGIWRGVIEIGNSIFVPSEGDEEVSIILDSLHDHQLPFNFEIKYLQNGDMKMIIHNADERYHSDTIDFGYNYKISKDTVVVPFPEYDARIEARFENNALEGHYINDSKTNYQLRFFANFGKNYRFQPRFNQEPPSLEGTWECTFGVKENNTYKAIAEFQQKGEKLTGTFMTKTGDYRFLEGVVFNDEAYLSAFDATHLFWFKIDIINEDSLMGIFKSGNHHADVFAAKKNSSFKLEDPYNLTIATTQKPVKTLMGTNQTGDIVNIISSSKKPQLLTVLGTWCPNCRDEILFLNKVKEKYGDKLNIAGLAFERYKDTIQALDAIGDYHSYLDVQFPLFYGGIANKATATNKLEFVDKIISFPTLILLDSDQKVFLIHTGFNGPATSKYDDFVVDFYKTIDKLIESTGHSNF